MRRLGVLGGTFDPVHNGHVLLAQFARERLELDEVLQDGVLERCRPSKVLCMARGDKELDARDTELLESAAAAGGVYCHTGGPGDLSL